MTNLLRSEEMNSLIVEARRKIEENFKKINDKKPLPDLTEVKNLDGETEYVDIANNSLLFQQGIKTIADSLIILANIQELTKEKL